MNRNVVAIIGAAGLVTESLRVKVTDLAQRLSAAGYDLVTGGEDGTMRAVARGHYLAGGRTALIHIEAGWKNSWQRNPYPASLVKTDMGSMRNHLVVRAADLVIAVSGQAGTLSEMAIAWQERKPIAALMGEGGWSEHLANSALDKRNDVVIEGCTTVDELIAWVRQKRPHGVFSGGLSRGFYPVSVCTLHRIRDSDNGNCPVHDTHADFGMSITQNDCEDRLKELHAEASKWNHEHQANTVALVTFDDGWKDVKMLMPVFKKYPTLCPVLFLGENHYQDDIRPLPMQRLYQYFSWPDKKLKSGKSLIEARPQLKQLPELDQHQLLDAEGVPDMLNPDWLLTPADIIELQNEGWIMASHGPSHEDLRVAKNLPTLLNNTAKAVEMRGHIPWLAWPEGQWSAQSVEVAIKAGFTLQFGLVEETGELPPPADVVMRGLWT